MANRFEEAAKKGKVPPGGLPEEITAGQEKELKTVQTEPETENVPKEETVQENTKAAVEDSEKEPERVVNSLVASYEDKRKIEDEPRSVRIQAVITPSINIKLNESLAKKEIKSKNDLINFLLESYYNTEKTD